jgi:hypothetical protein
MQQLPQAEALPLTVKIISWNKNFQKIVVRLEWSPSFSLLIPPPQVYLIQVQFNSRSWIVEKVS